MRKLSTKAMTAVLLASMTLSLGTPALAGDGVNHPGMEDQQPEVYVPENEVIENATPNPDAGNEVNDAPKEAPKEAPQEVPQEDPQKDYKVEYERAYADEDEDPLNIPLIPLFKYVTPNGDNNEQQNNEVVQPEAKEQPKEEAKPEAKEQPKEEAKPEAKEQPKEEAKPEAKEQPKEEVQPNANEQNNENNNDKYDPEKNGWVIVDPAKDANPNEGANNNHEGNDNGQDADDDFHLFHDDANPNAGNGAQTPGAVQQNDQNGVNQNAENGANNNENAGANDNENAGADFENVDQAEIDAAKAAEAEAAKAAVIKAAEAAAKRGKLTNLEVDRLRKGLSDAGEPVGRELVNVFNGEYDNAGDACIAICNATLKGLNENIVKNVPYVGGLMYGLLDQGLFKQAVVRDRFDDVIDRIDLVTDEVSKFRADYKESTRQTLINNEIGKANTTLAELRSMYDNHNVNFLCTMERITDRDRVTETDCDEISYIYTTDRRRHIENSDFDRNSSYLDVYTKFADQMLNKKGIAKSEELGCNGNIFDLTDAAWSYKNGKSGELPALMEVVGPREAFVATMEEIFTSGYEVLEQAIRFDKEKARNAALMCDVQSKMLQEKQAKATSYAERKAIKDQIDDLENKFSYYDTRSNNAAADYEKLLAKKAEIDTMIDNQKTRINNQKKDFNDNLPDELIEYYGSLFAAHQVTVTRKDSKGEDTYSYVQVYPHAENGKIEYRDVYGNLYGTQTLKKASRIEPSEMKVGGQYIIKVPYKGAGNSAYDREITVTGIREVENGFSNFFRQTLNPVHWFSGVSPATNRRVFYDYVEDGKKYHDDIGIVTLESFKEGVCLKTGNEIKYVDNVTPNSTYDQILDDIYYGVDY